MSTELSFVEIRDGLGAFIARATTFQIPGASVENGIVIIPSAGDGGGVNATSYKGASAPSATEFDYLAGVTSSIQTQLNARLLASALDDDVLLAANSTSRVPSQHAAKTYIDNSIAGLKFKQDVRAASTGNVSVSSAPAAIDGVTLLSGDRVLLKNQTTTSENGVYVFNGAGSALTRATDADTGTELVSATFPVREGTTNQDTWWTCTNDSITLGTTALVFTQTGGAGTYVAGAGLQLTGNSFSIPIGGVTNAMLAGSIAASKLVGSDIATVGTITAGAWQATKVGLAYGGTNADLSATGGAHKVLMQTAAGAAVTVAQLTTDDVAEGLNLYFTNARARAAVSGTAHQINYNSSTGVFSTPQDIDTTSSPTFAGLTLAGALNLNDVNVVLGTATGTKFGTATSQKLGFFNAAPIVQPSNTTDLRQALINLGLYASGGASPLDLNGGNLTAANVIASGATANLFNTAATTLNLGGAATALNVGASTGTATLNNATVSLAGTLLSPGTAYNTDIGQLSKKFKTIYAAELAVQNLVQIDTQITTDGAWLIAPSAQLIAAVATGDTSISVKRNNLTSGDLLRFETGGQLEFMQVTSGPSTISGGYSYSVTRNLDGTGANLWNAGDSALDTGQAGNGYWDIFSLHSSLSIVPDFIFNFNNTGSAFSATNYNQSAAWQPFADGANTEIGDAIYFGVQNTAWNNLYFNLTTAASYTATLTWEFWNGSAWTTFTPTKVGNTGTPFAAVGWQGFEWAASALTGWVSSMVNSQTAFWVRVRVSAFTSWTTLPQQSSRRVYYNRGQVGPTQVLWKRNSSTWNDITEHAAFGELVGFYGYSSSTVGIALGEYAAGKTHVTIDSTNGYRTFSGLSTVVQQIDASGNITVGQVGAGLANTYISAGTLAIRLNTTQLFGVDTSGNVTMGQVATNSGNAYWNNSNKHFEFRGGAGGTAVQAYIDTSGAFTAGGGSVTLDANGLTYQAYTTVSVGNALSTPNTVSWYAKSDAFIQGALVAGIGGAALNAAGFGELQLNAFGQNATGAGTVNIYAQNSSGTVRTQLRIIGSGAGGGGGSILMFGPGGSTTFGVLISNSTSDALTSGYKLDVRGAARVENDGLGSTSTDAISVTNTTAAALNSQQYSGRIRQTGNGWSTTNSASRTVDFAREVRPVQGAANPSGNLVWSASVNGAAYSDLMTLTTGGALSATSFSGDGSALTALNAGNISSGTLPVARGGTNKTSWTAGSVAYAASSSALGEDNANFFWDATNHRLGIGTTSPTGQVHIRKDVAGFNICYFENQTTGGNSAFIFLGTSGTQRGFFKSPTDTSTLVLGGGATDTLTVKAGTIQLNGYGAGTLQTDASGNVTASSDTRLKSVEGKFTRGLEALKGIEPVLYRWNELSGMEMEHTYAGLLAQDLISGIPEAVMRDSRGYYSLNDRALIAALINAVNELSAEVATLKAA